MITLKPNTYYKTRDGRKAFVGFYNEFRPQIDKWCGKIEGEGSTFCWCPDGTSNGWSGSPQDLVSEWTEPKLRPWNPDEVPLGACFRWKVRAVGEYLITGRCSDYMIVTVLGSINFDRAVNDGEHSTDNGKTWLPCGVME